MKEHVIINRDRTVVVPESLKKIGIQFDHNVNTITFDCPRYPDEDSSIDMSQMPIFINYMLPDKTPGSSLALNVVVDETDDTLMHFDWKITNAITPVNGVLSTLICVKQSDADGNELYHWNTDLFQKFTVGNGMECNGQVAEMNPDVITQLLARMGEVDTRTSAEAMSGYVNEYMTENPPQPTDEQVGSGVNTYMASNGQTHVDAYMTENQELVQNSVDDYLGRNPLQLDESLTDSTKAAPADKVGELKEDLSKSLNGLETFAQYVPFEHYRLNPDGTYLTSQQYRVSCDTHIILDRGISISVANGFKWGYIPFINGSAGNWSGWITVDSALPIGMEFVVQIARTTENSSEVANVSEFVSAITFNSNIGNKVDSLNNEIENEYALITGADVTFGNWANGEVTYNFIRLCTKQLIPIKAGDKVRYKTNTLQIGFGLFVNGEVVEYSGWVSAPTETEYIFQQDGLFFAQFRKSNNTVVELYEYDTVCKLYTGVRYDINHLANDVARLRDEVGRYNYSCVITDGTPPNPLNADCVYTTNKNPVNFGDHISLKTNRPVSASGVKYIYGVYGYNSSDTLIVNQSPTARASLPSDYVVNREDVAYIRYSVTEMDGSGNVVSVRASSFTGYDVVVYVDSDSKFYEYKYSGDYIDIKKKIYSVLATNLKVPTTTVVGASAIQGFAMYNSKVIQLYSNPSKLAIVDMGDNSVIATMDGNVGHGNTIDFFDEFENASDMFPLALVSDGISNEAYKVRIKTSGVTVKQTIKFPVEHCGYYVSTMLDKLNNIIYTVGYYENSYNTDSGSNKMVIAKWDYSNLASNEDGSVTPEFIESFYVPYFTTLQGPTFYNGKLFIISSKASSTDADTKIYVIDPYEKRVCSVISDFADDIKNKETESMYFYEDSDDVCCYLKNGDSSMEFFKMIFA